MLRNELDKQAQQTELKKEMKQILEKQRKWSRRVVGREQNLD